LEPSSITVFQKPKSKLIDRILLVASFSVAAGFAANELAGVHSTIPILAGLLVALGFSSNIVAFWCATRQGFMLSDGFVKVIRAGAAGATYRIVTIVIRFHQKPGSSTIHTALVQKHAGDLGSLEITERTHLDFIRVLHSSGVAHEVSLLEKSDQRKISKKEMSKVIVVYSTLAGLCLWLAYRLIKVSPLIAGFLLMGFFTFLLCTCLAMLTVKDIVLKKMWVLMRKIFLGY
jgi:hypothetical protein